MKTQKLRQLAIVAGLSMAFLIPPKSIQAQSLDFVEIPLESLHDKTPVELQGLVSSQTLNIPVPESWLPGEENWLEIQITASPLLDSTRSSLTISLNGLQIRSSSLSDIEQGRQRIPIPANRFTSGNNTLTFTGTLYLPDDVQTNCQNWDDVSRWLAVEPGGLLHLSFARQDLPVDLSMFPQVLMEPLETYLPDEAKKQPLIVLPENSTQDDLTSLSTISYILGRHAAGSYDWQPEIVSESQLKPGMAAERNIIFISNVPDEFQDRVSKDKDSVALFPSPWGLGKAVMIIGDRNRQDGLSPAAAFSDPARNVLMRGEVAYVDQYSAPTRQPLPNNVSFEELGYLDRTVRGLGQQSLIYSLYIPYDVEPVLAKLKVELVHSPDLDIQNSSFTVYLNGFSIAGILPTTRSSTGAPIEIGLPAKRFRRGINFIRVAFDLHLPRSSCDRALESVWATILNSSRLEMNYRDRAPTPSLKHFPLPFSDYSGFSFVVPDEYSQKDLGHLSRLSFMIGSSAYEPNRPPQVITASNFAQKEAEHQNIILVGLPSENTIIRNTNDLLLQPFVKDSDALQSGYGVYLPVSDEDASLGLMEIIPSPWVKGGAVLVLTGNDRQGLEWTWDAILNPVLWDQFSGNLMVIGSANRSATMQVVSSQQNPQALFQQIADSSNIPIIGALLQRGGQAFVVPALGAVGAALFLAIGVLWAAGLVRERKKSDAGEDTDQEEKDE